MREIKFRIYIEENRSEDNWINYCSLQNFDDINGSKNIMQFTGLHDKNGVDIYEGDIVAYNIYKAVIKHGIYEASLNVFGDTEKISGLYPELIKETDDGKGYKIHRHYPSHIEVIGNIYENKELLNEN